jgi:tRNA pseudouridine55 synthase
VVVRLGQRTPSADRESEVIESRELPQFTREHMREALAAFPREYSQVPPMHSALKQDGKPLYEYARAGITLEREPRDIIIRDMQLLEWQTPELSFDVRCTKGAYIRVLAEDLARQLGTIGHLWCLRRLGVSPFEAVPQWSFDILESMSSADREAVLLPLDAALEGCRRFDLPEAGIAALRQGQTVPIPSELIGMAPGAVRIYGAGRGFLGLGEIEAGRLVPVRLIAFDVNRA